MADGIFRFPRHAKTRQLGKDTLLDAYAQFLKRIATGDPRHYPAGYQPLVADGDENRHMSRTALAMRHLKPTGGQE